MIKILGLNAFHGDASACLLIDGELIAAAEEERFRRVKHWAGLPSESVQFCLDYAGIDISEIDHIAINRDPSAHSFRKATFALRHRPNVKSLFDRFKNANKVQNVLEALADTLAVSHKVVRAQLHHIEHHLAHLASAFYVSPYQEAAVVSVDGFGDFSSTMWGIGNQEHITVCDQVYYPHSLGLFYTAITQYLGFPHYGDEYKVMGLASYGKPTLIKKMRQIVELVQGGFFELDLNYFTHVSEGVAMTWEQGEPVVGRVYSDALIDLLGPVRKSNETLCNLHWDIAASAQAMYEEAFFHLLNQVYRKTRINKLCLAGGCAMNSVANGRIFELSEFRDVYIQSAAGDAGGAIGAAFSVWHDVLGNQRSFEMTHAYWGPSYKDSDISQLLEQQAAVIADEGCVVSYFEDEQQLFQLTAAEIAEGKVIGWFQGRMEWGPRALGNRSILGDPRRADMKNILNCKIKRRESFRPFAPSILREETSSWFETDADVPFMLQVFQIRQDKQKLIPAVTHVNGSGRLQTVTQMSNQRYYQLISAFHKLTGVPILLNTSFNENEPVVCRPEEALNCFLRTKMDMLVLGNYVVERK